MALPHGWRLRLLLQLPTLVVPQPSAPSQPVQSIKLPSLALGGVRLELRLATPQADRDMIQMRRDVETDVSNALNVPKDAVTVQEVYGVGRYVVLDLHADVQTGSRQFSSADLLAQQLQLLAHQLAEGQSGGLRSGKVTADLDVTAGGVHFLTDDGRLTAIRVGQQTRDTLASLPRYYSKVEDSNPLLTSARRFTMLVVGLGTALFFAATVYRHRSLVRASSAGYVSASTSDQ